MQFTTEDTPRTIAAKLAIVAMAWGAYWLYQYVDRHFGAGAFLLAAYVALCLAALGVWLYWLRWVSKPSPKDQIPN